MPSYTYQMLTELEAVNQMLSVIGEAPVSTLEGINDVQVAVARQMLYDVSREIQSEGWYFNTDVEYQLMRDGSNYVNVPSNVLTLDISKYSGKDYIQRGSRLYDRENHTYVFTEDPKVDIVQFLDWDTLPQSARQYITICAARRFQRRFLGSDLIDSITREEEYRAKAQMEDADAWSRDYNMADSLDIQQTLMR